MSRLLIRNAAIVSVDPQIGTIPAGDILVEDDRIAAIGTGLAAPEGADIIDASEMIAMPGFVNAHIHTWQAGLRGIAVDWTLGEYLRAMHAGLATHFRPDDIRIANHVGGLNQLNAGTTTLADWCHNNPTPDHTDAAIDGLEASGARAVFLHGSPKPDARPGQPHFSEVPMPRDEVVRLRQGRLSSDEALVTLGLAVLGPQLSVADVCDSDFRLAKEFGLIASMHVSGPMLTPDGFKRLSEAGLLGGHINVVHGNSLADDMLRFLVDHDVSFTPTPEVELQMGFGDPLTSRLRRLGGRISIGSDIESSMAGDMFAVTRFALQAARHADNLAARASDGKPPAAITIPSGEALQWATIEGARMLGLDDRIGSLTVGKQADIVLLDASAINMRPVHDPVASVLFHAGVGNVDTVLVAGRIVKQGGRLLAAGVESLTDAVAQSGRRIIADFNTDQRAG
jgi:cytosine/adenosine deaminase-related metal-dependent hydrolase